MGADGLQVLGGLNEKSAVLSTKKTPLARGLA
jgi:hypothetical protein